MNDVIHTYLGYKIVTIQNQLMGIASLNKDTPRKSAFVVDSTRCTPVNNSVGSLIVSCISLRNIFPCFLQCSFPVLYIIKWYVESDA
jgi:hypothetical protein